MKILVKTILSPAERKNLYILKEKLERKENSGVKLAQVSNMNQRVGEFGKLVVR